MNRRLLLFAAGGFMVAVGLSVWLLPKSAAPLVNPAGAEKVLSAQDPSPLPEAVNDLSSLNLLLLGYGGAGHEGGGLTDAITLVHFDFKQAKIGLISMPRDLWIDGQKINHLYASSYDALKDAVATITGESVNYFIAVDFVGFQRAMGYVLDGIEVNVAQDFDDPWYPIEGTQLEPCGHTPEEIGELTAKYADFELQKQFPCRYERIHFDQGMVFMNGGEALKYVRSRHSSSDFDRSRRQHEVLVGIKNKLFSLQALNDIPKFFSEFTKYVQTDLDREIVKYLAPVLKMSRDYRIVSINLSTENVLKASKANSGAFIVMPQKDWEEVRNLVRLKLND